MRHLKSLVLVAALAAVAGPSFAGGFAPVVPMPTPVVVVDTPMAPRSSFGVILPLALLGGLIALAVASSDNDNDES